MISIFIIVCLILYLFGYAIYIIKTRKRTLIFIEGNIASGKTTLLKKIDKCFPKYNIVEEPVDDWLEVGTLKASYENPKRWLFTFQVHTILTRYMAIWLNIKNSNKNLFIERSGYADKIVFYETYYDKADDMEINVYDLLYYDVLKHMYPLNKYNIKVIYLNTSDDVCCNRYRERSRKGETLDNKYINEIAERHNQYLMPYFECKYGKKNILEINGDVNFIHNDNDMNSIVSQIRDFL